MSEKEEVEATFSHFHQLISGLLPTLCALIGELRIPDEQKDED